MARLNKHRLNIIKTFSRFLQSWADRLLARCPRPSGLDHTPCHCNKTHTDFQPGTHKNGFTESARRRPGFYSVTVSDSGTSLPVSATLTGNRQPELSTRASIHSAVLFALHLRCARASWQHWHSVGCQCRRLVTLNAAAAARARASADHDLGLRCTVGPADGLVPAQRPSLHRDGQTLVRVRH
jgi:hypothetical protein